MNTRMQCWQNICHGHST